jgi:hypothetical protein
MSNQRKPGRPAGTTKLNNKASITIRLPPEIVAKLPPRKAAQEIERALRLLWATESGPPCDRCGYPAGADWLDDGETCPKCRLVH